MLGVRLLGKHGEIRAGPQKVFDFIGYQFDLREGKVTNKTESCKTTVQLLQNVHGVDITHDVFSSMLSCYFSYVAATLNRVSYF